MTGQDGRSNRGGGGRSKRRNTVIGDKAGENDDRGRTSRLGAVFQTLFLKQKQNKCQVNNKDDVTNKSMKRNSMYF